MIYVGLKFILLVSFEIFVLGLLGLVIARNHPIFTLISIEIIILSANILFISTSIFNNDFSGQLFALFVLAVAAAESILGLALIVLLFRIQKSVLFSDLVNVRH